MKTAQERDLLAEAQKRGITVHFSHQRVQVYPYNKLDGDLIQSAKGGRTYCTLLDLSDPDKPVTLAKASARCSRKDTYNKGIGRAIALGRAFKLLEQQVV